MNILVTGACGQLGRQMQDVSRCSTDSYFFTDVCEGCERLDITDIEAVRDYVRTRGIEVIVNCAAWTDVDGAETAGPIVETLNATAPENLATVMKETGGLLVHISTDYVFGAEPYNTPCSEDRKGTPTGVYGLTKLHGEQNIIASGCEYLIIRTGWLYSEYGRNFCKTILRLTAEKPSLKVVSDQVGTPTYAYDLANAIYKILSERLYVGRSGIYNYSNEGVCSWFDFAKAIAAYAGRTSCVISPCRSDEFPSPVRRPAYSVLDKTKIKETFSVSVPYWTDSLRLCLSKLQ